MFRWGLKSASERRTLQPLPVYRLGSLGTQKHNWQLQISKLEPIIAAGADRVPHLSRLCTIRASPISKQCFPPSLALLLCRWVWLHRGNLCTGCWWAACLQHDEWATEMRVDDGRRVELEEDDNGQILIFTVVNNDRFFGQGVTGYSFPFWQRKWWNVYFKSTYFFDYEGGHHSTKSCSCSQTLEFIKEQHSARFATLTDHLVKSGRMKAKMLY